jgi:large subunit ribosomal protein L11
MPPRKEQTLRVTLELPAGDAPMMDLGKMLGQTGVNLVELKRTYDAAPTEPLLPTCLSTVVLAPPDKGLAVRRPNAHLSTT